MAKLGFYLIYSVFWLLAWLPLPVLYVFSDIFFIIIYYGIGYRKKVVWNNLRNSFPEKTDAEIKVLQRKFFRHFCDLFVEILKLMHMPLKVMTKRSKFENLDYIHQALKDGKSVIAYMSHYANWEYIPFVSSFLEKPSASIYHPLRNPYFDKVFNKIRGQYGLQLFPMKTAFRSIIKMRKEAGQYVVGVISDQAPPNANNRLWVPFLNQDTATFLGGEKMAQSGENVVVYFQMRKVKRGYYVTEIVPMSETPKDLPEYALTLQYHKILEDQIKAQPELWLWSHRRWKRKRPEDENLIKEIR